MGHTKEIFSPHYVEKANTWENYFLLYVEKTR